VALVLVLALALVVVPLLSVATFVGVASLRWLQLLLHRPETKPIPTLRAEARSGGVGVRGGGNGNSKILKKKSNELVEEKKATNIQTYLWAQTTPVHRLGPCVSFLFVVWGF
jgi:hypothetical protein